MNEKLPAQSAFLQIQSIYLSRDILLQLYHAVIKHHLRQVISVWGSTFQTYFDELISYQNKALKTIIAKAKWNNSPSPLYSKLGGLKLAKTYQLEVAKIMNRIDTKKPSSFFS